MNKLYIDNKTDFKFKYKNLFKKIIKLTCKLENIKVKSEVNLIIVNNKEIKELSSQYRNKNKETDVLSFPSDYKNLFNIIGYNMFGDIYISYQKLNEQANEYNHSLKREWAYIFTHGLYHLLGYDHTKSKKEENIMNDKVDEIMKLVKVGRNV